MEMVKGPVAPPVKIVVVDDSQVVLDLVRDALTQHGYEVIGLTNPFGFSNLLKREQPSLALVDVAMPALLGTRLVEIAQRAGVRGCRILLYSDRPEDELAALASQCGADGYIRKSRDMHRLVDLVRTYLRK